MFVEMLDCVSTYDQDRAQQKAKILMIYSRTLLRNGYLNPLDPSLIPRHETIQRYCEESLANW